MTARWVVPAALLASLAACCLTAEGEGTSNSGSSTSGGSSASSSASSSTTGSGSSTGSTGGGSTRTTGGSSSGGCPAIDAGLPNYDPDAGYPQAQVVIPAFVGACGRGLGFAGCGSSPEFTEWQQLAYDVALPAGSDGALQVRLAYTLDAGVLGSLEPVTVCGSLRNGCCPNPIVLAASNLPGAEYFIVTVEPLTGGCNPDAGPWLAEATVSAFCPDN